MIEAKLTTKFDSKLEAIATGLMYAGRKDLYSNGSGGIESIENILKNPQIKVVNDNIEQFGYAHEDTLMIEFQNNKNRVCRIAVTRFRDGFDLWLIDPESGFAHRT